MDREENVVIPNRLAIETGTPEAVDAAARRTGIRTLRSTFTTVPAAVA